MKTTARADVPAVGKTLDASTAEGLLPALLASSVLRQGDWDALSADKREELSHLPDPQKLLARLVAENLLSDYQASRVALGKIGDLLLGNYRILDCLGRGAMGVVLKAEHLFLRRLVALKLVRLPAGSSSRLLERFGNEIAAISQLQHPHIVMALDAGVFHSPDPDAPVLHYLALEYVPGPDLEEYVRAHGPMKPEQACELTYQAASALAEVQAHHLLHRDIKPANIRLTEQGEAKLLDFGLARHFGHRLTDPGTTMGTAEYLAPEQAQDASRVDIRADLFSLGATLYWCLTGKAPFPSGGNILHDLARRRTQPSPSLRAWRPELPAELDQVVARLMALDPDDRYAAPEQVLQVLLPFLKPATRARHLLCAEAPVADQPAEQPDGLLPEISSSPRILIVDDEENLRLMCQLILEREGYHCEQAENGLRALEIIAQRPFDLVLLDIDMPQMNGVETLRRLRENPPQSHLKVIMFSGRATGDDMAELMVTGADDFLTKPFTALQLLARVKNGLRLKAALDQSDRLNQYLVAMNHELEQNLHARDSDLVHARNALVLALAELVAHRDTETGAHLLRLQRYVRCLAEEVSVLAAFNEQLTEPYIQMLEACAPLHDIGKAGLPDYVFLKPGPLTPQERKIMEAHTTIGADTLQKVARRHGFARAFLQIAVEITRHHHERYDGAGYPDGLAGDAIPLSARLLSLCDVYDALRSRRIYKPALSHDDTMEVMKKGAPGQFDPALFQVFLRCAGRFEQFYAQLVE